MNDIDTEILKGIANQLRIHSIAATTAAGSGHPTSCCSAADVVAALFFGHMRYDPKNPHFYNNDRFILSKGHAAPLLYAAWAETGRFPAEELLTLRRLDSDLEGHPTPRLPFVDVATGSLGQGLAVGVGMKRAKRVIVEDVTQSPIFRGHPALEVILDAGARSVQSTPLTDPSGRILGMLSTHWRSPRRLSESELATLDMLAKRTTILLRQQLHPTTPKFNGDPSSAQRQALSPQIGAY